MQAQPEPSTPINVTQDQTDMGVYVKIGECWSINNAIHPPDWAMVMRVRATIDPYFVPLWVDKFWRSPNGGLRVTGHHVIGRSLPPFARRTRAYRRKGPVHVVKPTWLPFRIPYPVLPCYTLDGASRERIEQGGLPLYQDFDNATLSAMKKAVWERENITPEEQHRLEMEARAKRKAAYTSSTRDRLRARLESRMRFRTPKVFVSERQREFTASVSNELLRLRALAGHVVAGE